MGLEIERKFLVKDSSWRHGPDGAERQGTRFRQGYIPTEGLTTVRVRVEGDSAKLTIKGKNEGLARAEYEYEIPMADAESMLDQLCAHPMIEKTRYCIPVEGMLWELDVFEGENAGLILAEVELEHEGQAFPLPDWAGEEVSQDARYYNVNLVNNPYKNWR